MNRLVAQMLGESTEVVDAEADAPAASPHEPAQIVYTNPSVEHLVALWQGGQQEAVALRVLDALDHYADFLELAFQIGHDDAIQLGQIMDALTSEEKSPHEYDQVSDLDLPQKVGKHPLPGDAHAAVGE